jgi:N-acyl-D-aspartate/D-glutamate deacylase
MRIVMRFLAVVALGTTLVRAADPIECDILLKNGTIVDGSGRAASAGSVAIKGEVIAAAGEFEVAGQPLVIDCTGLLICPGFIDLHNHSDEQIVTPAMRANINFLTQACTTVVTGNCGSGPTDTAAYYRQIDDHGAGTNVAHLIPHGSLHERVMGNEDRPPTAQELAEMRRLAEIAMDDGAWGMSTGLIYVPGCYATTDEIVAVAEVVGERGGIYASHIRNEGVDLLASVQELLEIGRRADLPAHVSHFKASGRDAWGLTRQAAEMIEAARQAGQQVTADQYPYVASSTSLEATVIPTWARAGGREALVTRLADPEIGPRLREEIAESIQRKDEGRAIRFARYSERQDWVGRSLADVAQAEGTTPVEIAVQVTGQGGAAIVHFSMNEDEVRDVMQWPWVATASDGRAALPGADKPHPRFYGTFPRKIGLYALGEQVISLEQAVRSASGLPADILRLSDRGYLRPGLAADVVVLNPARYIDTATFDEPHQYATGVDYVFVNGTPAVFDGHVTGALAGRALRKSPVAH